MANRSFADFVNEKNRAAKEPEFDAVARLNSWKEQINSLYEQVRDFLSPFTETGDVRIEKRFITINEELLGVYETQKLVISIGTTSVELFPVGAIIFGARGRVDLRGPRDLRKLVLVPKNAKRAIIRVLTEDEFLAEGSQNKGDPELTWKISFGPRHDYIELDQDSFTKAIMDVTQ